MARPFVPDEPYRYSHVINLREALTEAHGSLKFSEILFPEIRKFTAVTREERGRASAVPRDIPLSRNTTPCSPKPLNVRPKAYRRCNLSAIRCFRRKSIWQAIVDQRV